jgi:hypothetical protein
MKGGCWFNTKQEDAKQESGVNVAIDFFRAAIALHSKIHEICTYTLGGW